MAQKLILRWDNDGDPEILHRVRNMGEDLWSALNEGGGALSIAEVDSAVTHFSVSARRNEIGPLTELIRRKLKRHNLEHVVRIERGEDG